MVPIFLQVIMVCVFGSLFPLIALTTPKSQGATKLHILRRLQKSAHKINAILTICTTIAGIVVSPHAISALVSLAFFCFRVCLPGDINLAI